MIPNIKQYSVKRHLPTHRIQPLFYPNAVEKIFQSKFVKTIPVHFKKVNPNILKILIIF